MNMLLGAGLSGGLALVDVMHTFLTVNTKQATQQHVNPVKPHQGVLQED